MGEKYNLKVQAIEPSRSVTLLGKVKELQKTDNTIINMTAGEPDFDSPKAVRDTLIEYLEKGYTHYTDSKGEPELREAIIRKLSEENGVDFRPENVLVTPGAKFAVYAAVNALVNPGDEVLWLTPGWVSYPSMITMCGGTPVAVHLDYDKDYRITADILQEKTTEKTKALIINYPNNPTGKILSDEEIEELKSYLLANPQVYVISDEIYEKLIYDGRKVRSIAAEEEIRDRVIVINGFSKCSAMTGYRCGYLACAPEIYALVQKIFQHTISCTSGFVQQAALTALSCTKETEEMRAAFEERRNLLVEGLNGIPGVELKIPEGSFYAWVRFDTEKSSDELAMEILNGIKVAGIAGSAYGEEKACCIRFFFANEKLIEEMVTRIRSFVESDGLKG